MASREDMAIVARQGVDPHQGQRDGTAANPRIEDQERRHRVLAFATDGEAPSSPPHCDGSLRRQLPELPTLQFPHCLLACRLAALPRYPPRLGA